MAWKTRTAREVVPSPSAAAERGEHLRAAIERTLRRLPPQWAMVLRWRFFDGLDGVQMAQRLGLTRSAITSIERQARQRLREIAPHLADLAA